jgi:hypothetical protein
MMLVRRDALSARILVVLALLAELLFSSILVVDRVRRADLEAQRQASVAAGKSGLDLALEEEAAAFMPTWLKVAATITAALCLPAPWLLWKARRRAETKREKALIVGTAVWYLQALRRVSCSEFRVRG